MKQNSCELQMLKQCYTIQLPDKSLLRLLGKSGYQWNGRIAASLFKKKLIKSADMRLYPKAYMLTKEGYDILQEYYEINPSLTEKLKSRICNKKGKKLQYKISSSIQMLYELTPEYLEDFLHFEIDILPDVMSPVNINSASKSVRIMTELKRRKSLNSAGYYFITSREIRELDADGLRNMQATRAVGLACLAENYIIFNTLKRRMRNCGDYDRLFRSFVEDSLHCPVYGSITFGLSYKPFIDSIRSKLIDKPFYTLSSRIFKKSFFVLQTPTGASQMFIYGIPDFNNKLSKALFTSEEIASADNSIYSAIKDGEKQYLGFECDYNEIESLYTMSRGNPNISIYCFPHQIPLYKEIFGEAAKLYSIEPQTIKKYFKKEV